MCCMALETNYPIQGTVPWHNHEAGLVAVLPAGALTLCQDDLSDVFDQILLSEQA